MKNQFQKSAPSIEWKHKIHKSNIYRKSMGKCKKLHFSEIRVIAKQNLHTSDNCSPRRNNMKNKHLHSEILTILKWFSDTREKTQPNIAMKNNRKRIRKHKSSSSKLTMSKNRIEKRTKIVLATSKSTDCGFKMIVCERVDKKNIKNLNVRRRKEKHKFEGNQRKIC